MPWLFSFSLASFPDRGEHFIHTRNREGREDGCVSNSARKASTSANRYRMSEPIFSPRILGDRRVVWSRTQRSETPSFAATWRAFNSRSFPGTVIDCDVAKDSIEWKVRSAVGTHALKVGG
jgi:hypothetical protein